MSNYVVIARFDETTNDKFMELRSQLLKEGYSMPEWPPHITIAAYENMDGDNLCAWTDEFAKKHSQILFQFPSISILPPGGEHTDTAVLCLEPSHSKKLIDFYYEFHEKYEEYCTGIGEFNSIVQDNPVVHATIGIFHVEKMQKVLQIIFKSVVFRECRIEAIEVYTYPMKLLGRYELK